MSFFFWTFMIGLLGIIFMISFKYREISSGKAMILSGITNNTNHIAHEWKDKLVSFLKAINKRNTFNFVVTVVHFFSVLWMRAINYLKSLVLKHRHSRRIIEAVKGRYDLAEKREASPFFKKIEQDRDL
ncbi:MAG: hypothetical protein Q7R78_00770 [bacterium]|nr:hypothetical protein [bacterium]